MSRKMRLRHLLTLNPSLRLPSGADESTEVSFLPMESIHENGTFSAEIKRPIVDVRDGYSNFEEGDIALAKVTPCFENGKAAILDELGSSIGFGTTEITVIRPHGQIRTDFLFYVLKSEDFLEGGKAAMTGAGGLKRVPDSYIRNFAIDLPPKPIQEQVVRFLDRETAQIDELIAKQEQLIVLLAERQGVILAGALSGPESLLEGNANEQWIFAPLGLLSALQSGLTLGRDVQPEFAVEMPYLRVANVQIGRVDLAEVKTVSVESTSWRKHQLIAGDVLMTEGGDIDKLGRGSIWGGEIEPCLHQNHVFSIRCGPRLLNRWLEYVLAGPQARTYFQTTAKKSTNLASTNSTVVKAFRVPLPSMDEQVRLVSELDKVFDGLRDLTNKATEMIALLKERRQALISAAVTGKIDVTGKV